MRVNSNCAHQVRPPPGRTKRLRCRETFATYRERNRSLGAKSVERIELRGVAILDMAPEDYDNDENADRCDQPSQGPTPKQERAKRAFRAPVETHSRRFARRELTLHKCSVATDEKK